MKNFISLLLTITSFLSLPIVNKAQQVIDADNPALIYSGRFDFSNPKAPEFGYSSCRIRTKFEGTSLKIKLSSTKDLNYILVVIDSVYLPKFKVQTSTTELTVATGLKDTIHNLEIIKITACAQGSCIFKGLTLDAGKSVVTGIIPETRKIHFIGNSITCGYGIEVLNNALHYDPATENSNDAYATITARSLNSDFNIVARSGIGIYRNYGDPSTGSSDNMYAIYNRTFHDRSNSLWNFSKFQPDVLCINLGTNDFSENNGDATLFTTQYDKFIDTLRLKYPNANIVLLMGPMLNTSALKNIVQNLVTKHTNAGDSKISMLELSAQGALGYGADWHPSKAQARKNAAELITYIKKLKGWNSFPIPQTVNTTNGGSCIDIEFNDSISTGLRFKGFEIYADSINIPTDSIILINGAGKKIRIYLKTRIKQAQKVEVKYLNGNIRNIDGMPLQKFNNLSANNTVTDIKINSYQIQPYEFSIQLNKDVLPVSCNDFRCVDSKKLTVPIDSINIDANKLIFYVKRNLSTTDSIYLSYNGTCIIAADNVPLYPIEHYGMSCQNVSLFEINQPSSAINIFPNPIGKNGLTVKIDFDISECLKISITTLEGKAIFNDTICTNEYKIPTNVFNQKKQNYIINITGTNKGNTIAQSYTFVK